MSARVVIVWYPSICFRLHITGIRTAEKKKDPAQKALLLRQPSKVDSIDYGGEEDIRPLVSLPYP